MNNPRNDGVNNPRNDGVNNPQAQKDASTRRLNAPNLITALRLVLIPLLAFVFLSGKSDLIAFVLLALIGWSDFLDGFIARRTGQVTELGKVLDPLADRLAVITILGVFVFRGVIAWQLAVVILARDVVVLIIFGVLEKKGYPRIAVNRTGKAATAAIFAGVAVAGLNLAMGDSASLRVASMTLLIAGAAAYWAAVVLYAAEIRKLKQARDPVT